MVIGMSNKNQYILQLESIYNSIIVDNRSTSDFDKKDISITILPTSQPIGFVIDYTNMEDISKQSTGLLVSKSLGVSSKIDRDYLYPNIVKELSCIPDAIKMTVTMVIKKTPINPTYIPITLKTSTNGKITEITANGLFGANKLILSLNYTYIKTNYLYKWVIINSTLKIT